MDTILSKLDGERELRCAVTLRPTTEKILSDGTLLTRSDRIVRARCDGFGECMQNDTYPKPSHLALTILSLLVSSVPSERIFSVVGLKVTAQRSSLSPSSFDKIVSIHENSQFSEED